LLLFAFALLIYTTSVLTLSSVPAPILELTKMGMVVPTGSSQKSAKMPKEDEGEGGNGEKKKKGKKNRSGGKLWKLSEKAFLPTAEKIVPAPVKSED
jgi:hypothetical protein